MNHEIDNIDLDSAKIIKFNILLNSWLIFGNTIWTKKDKQTSSNNTCQFFGVKKTEQESGMRIDKIQSS